MVAALALLSRSVVALSSGIISRTLDKGALHPSHSNGDSPQPSAALCSMADLTPFKKIQIQREDTASHCSPLVLALFFSSYFVYGLSFDRSLSFLGLFISFCCSYLLWQLAMINGQMPSSSGDNKKTVNGILTN